MRVLLDSNVLLASVLQRPPWHRDADAILQAVALGRLSAAATSLSLATLCYVGRKTVGPAAARAGVRRLLAGLVIEYWRNVIAEYPNDWKDRLLSAGQHYRVVDAGEVTDTDHDDAEDVANYLYALLSPDFAWFGPARQPGVLSLLRAGLLAGRHDRAARKKKLNRARSVSDGGGPVADAPGSDNPPQGSTDRCADPNYLRSDEGSPVGRPVRFQRIVAGRLTQARGQRPRARSSTVSSDSRQLVVRYSSE